MRRGKIFNHEGHEEHEGEEQEWILLMGDESRQDGIGIRADWAWEEIREVIRTADNAGNSAE